MEDKQSTLAIGDTAHTSDDISFDEQELVPHFQRVSISGEDTSGVPLEDLEHASSLIIRALDMRERYMSLSLQSFPKTTERFLQTVHNKTMSTDVEYEDKRTTAGKCSKFTHCIYWPQKLSNENERWVFDLKNQIRIFLSLRHYVIIIIIQFSFCMHL